MYFDNVEELAAHAIDDSLQSVAHIGEAIIQTKCCEYKISIPVENKNVVHLIQIRQSAIF